jgi:hypothetical protein
MPQVVVLFNSMPDGSGRSLRAIAGTGVRGVLVGKAARTLLLEKVPGLQHLPRTIPSATEVLLLEDRAGEDPVETSLRLSEGEEGPSEVCYWVGSRLICWDED